MCGLGATLGGVMTDQEWLIGQIDTADLYRWQERARGWLSTPPVQRDLDCVHGPLWSEGPLQRGA